MDKRARNLILAIAGALLIAALFWGGSISKNSRLSALARALSVYGYSLSPEDLYVAHSGGKGSVEALMGDMDLAAAVEASIEAGFPSDIRREGTVELVLAALPNEDVITLFLLDGEVELAFVQRPESDLVYALGGVPEA